MMSLARIGGGLARAGLVWWFGELTALVPSSMLRWFTGSDHLLNVRVQRGGLSIDGRGTEACFLPLDGETLPPAIRAALRGGTAAVLRLPALMVLRRTVELPLAVVSELHAAASFLVGRLTPFPPEQACHAVRPLARDRTRKVVHAELAVVPRGALEHLLAVLDNYGIPVSAIRVEGDDGNVPFDFLPHQATRRHTRHPRRGAWKPVLAAGLALAVMGPVSVAYHTHTRAEALATEVAAASGAGHQAAALRSAVEARAVAAAFLPARLRGPRVTEVLDALTRALPDDTWLFGLEVRPGEATLAGFSRDVPGVLGRLQSPLFDAPELISPIEHGLADGRDRFEIRLRVRQAAR